MLNCLFSFSLLLTLALSAYLIWLSGVLNIALEGIFLWSVFSAFFILQTNYDFSLVLVFTFLSTCFCLGIFYIFHFQIGINENFIGIILNVFILSLLDIFNQIVFKRQGILLFKSSIINLILFRKVMVFLFLSLFFVISYLLFKTPTGLRLRMAGSPVSWKKERGVFIHIDRLILFGVAGVLISLAGVALLISLNAYTVGLGSGMGWISLFSFILGFYSLRGVFFSSAFLGISLLFSYWVQEWVGFYFSQGLPYLSSFLAYGVISWWWERKKERQQNL